MKDYERLRKALEQLKEKLVYFQYRAEMLEEMLTIAQDALAETSQDSEEETAEIRTQLQLTFTDWSNAEQMILGLEDELADLRAQVAVMTIILEEMDEIVLGQEKPTLGTHIRIKDALSAAPKVLHHETGKWDSEYLMWPVVRFKRPLMLDARSPDDVMTGVSFCAHGPQRFDEFPGQQVEVFVTEWPRHHGQPQDSEQEG